MSNLLRIAPGAAALMLIRATSWAGPLSGFPGGFTVTGYAPGLWGTTGAAIGLSAEDVIEDFEDAALIPGLRIAVTTGTSGSYGPSATLPATFDPVANDPFGSAFAAGVWDGSRVLVNTGTNQSAPYGGQGNWGDVQLLLTTPAARVAFSVHQLEDGATVSVNGFPLGSLLTLAGLQPGSGRNGYVVIEAPNPASLPITFVEINNAAGDGFVIDHLAVRFVYCPGDANGDGFVLFEDLNVVLGAFNTLAGEPGYNGAADFDENGAVDFEDLNEVLSRFNDPCTGG